MEIDLFLMKDQSVFVIHSMRQFFLKKCVCKKACIILKNKMECFRFICANISIKILNLLNFLQNHTFFVFSVNLI